MQVGVSQQRTLSLPTSKVIVNSPIRLRETLYPLRDEKDGLNERLVL